MLNLLEKYILNFLDNIYGLYIYDLINNIGNKINNIDRLNKGYIGNLIEKYINLNISRKDICDISLINLEIKTFGMDYNKNLLNDISLISFKYLNLFIILEKLFYKIKNILFIPIIGNKYSCIENKIIGKAFILKFSKYNILSFKNELYNLNNFIKNNYNNKYFINNFYTKRFRLQFFLNKNKEIFLNIFFRKKFILNIINKNNIIF